jgi:50S ribosomal protein L16 3-hydroxylase
MSSDWQIDLDPAVFLAEHWQRKPLLIRNIHTQFAPPLGSDELAGLALEDYIESRLVEQRGDTWELNHGPFEESDFARNHPWTLLVQAVDHYVPEVAELRRLFDFIPRWRMDDVMVSYASDGGSVGPHYDNYDVFLLQGEGQRLWRLGQLCDSTTALIPHDELRILRNFELDEEYLLGPGDILYVPPGVAHWGIAQGECTTFSIGFRAPRVSDMLSRCTDELLLQMNGEDFFRDAGRAHATRPGEIDTKDIGQAVTQLHRALDQAKEHNWFGELVTEPRYEIETDEDDIAEAQALLIEGARSITPSPAAKLAWIESTNGLTVFANGESLHCARSTLPTLLMLCEGRALVEADLDKALTDQDTTQLLEHLLLSGCIHVR